MQEWYILGVGCGVFGEVSSVQGCPYRGVPMKFGRAQRYRCTSILVPRLPLLRTHNVSLSGQRSYATLCARRRESLGTRLVYSIATYIMCV